MENEIKSVLDIIAEISKKDKKKQVFILTNLINQLKSTRIEGWERSIKLDKLCYSREEAIEYIKSLGDKEDEI